MRPSHCEKTTYLANVWVGIIGIDASVDLHVLEGMRHVAAPTAVVAGDAVDQVLWAEIQQLPSLLLELSLQGPARAKSPAGATRALSGKKIQCELKGEETVMTTINMSGHSGTERLAWPEK